MYIYDFSFKKNLGNYFQKIRVLKVNGVSIVKKNVCKELKEYFTVIPCFGQDKAIQCDTRLCDRSLCKHIYIHILRSKLFVSSLWRNQVYWKA